MWFHETVVQGPQIWLRQTEGMRADNGCHAHAPSKIWTAEIISSDLAESESLK